jgi:hypothetical protein
MPLISCWTKTAMRRRAPKEASCRDPGRVLRQRISA